MDRSSYLQLDRIEEKLDELIGLLTEETSEKDEEEDEVKVEEKNGTRKEYSQ